LIILKTVLEEDDGSFFKTTLPFIVKLVQKTEDLFKDKKIQILEKESIHFFNYYYNIYNYKYIILFIYLYYFVISITYNININTFT
jgi:hypothetical protein